MVKKSNKWTPSWTQTEVAELNQSLDCNYVRSEDNNFPRMPSEILGMWRQWESGQNFLSVDAEKIFTSKIPGLQQAAEPKISLERLPRFAKNKAHDKGTLIVHSKQQYDFVCREGDLRTATASEIRNVELRIMQHPYTVKSTISWCAHKLKNPRNQEDYQLLPIVEEDRAKATLEHASKSHASLYNVAFDTYDGFSCVMGYTKHNHKKDEGGVQITHVWLLLAANQVPSHHRERACNLLLNICGYSSIFPMVVVEGVPLASKVLRNSVWASSSSQPAATNSECVPIASTAVKTTLPKSAPPPPKSAPPFPKSPNFLGESSKPQILRGESSLESLQSVRRSLKTLLEELALPLPSRGEAQIASTSTDRLPSSPHWQAPFPPPQQQTDHDGDSSRWADVLSDCGSYDSSRPLFVSSCVPPTRAASGAFPENASYYAPTILENEEYWEVFTFIGNHDDYAGSLTHDDYSVYDEDERERYKELVEIVKKAPQRKFKEPGQITRKEAADRDRLVPCGRENITWGYAKDNWLDNRPWVYLGSLQSKAIETAIRVNLPEEAIKRELLGWYARFFETMGTKPRAADKENGRSFVDRVYYDTTVLKKHMVRIMEVLGGISDVIFNRKKKKSYPSGPRHAQDTQDVCAQRYSKHPAEILPYDIKGSIKILQELFDIP